MDFNLYKVEFNCDNDGFPYRATGFFSFFKEILTYAKIEKNIRMEDQITIDINNINSLKKIRNNLLKNFQAKFDREWKMSDWKKEEIKKNLEYSIQFEKELNEYRENLSK